MDSFKTYLDKTGEIGFVSRVLHFLAYVEGLPHAKMNEIVVFEDGEIGEVMSLGQETVEVLLLSKNGVKVGTKAARTDSFLEIRASDGLLGKSIDPLGEVFGQKFKFISGTVRPIDSPPPEVLERTFVNKPLETGVSLVDLVIPLGKGQRELVIGDRKTGKTAFLLQTIYNQVRLGAVCVYAAIGKKRVEIKRFEEFFKKKGIEGSIVTVATASSDSPGLIYLTPYTAMTVAEYFRDKGRDVLVVLDDLTVHANYYREITLLAKRFPGRNSYPGDIFYIHSRLMERAGSFPKGTISALPVAESILGDMSGYIQTNLMSMTDGHIFFDSEYANLGRRPAINPFISVTRVGQQAQSVLLRDLSRNLSRFLVKIERLRTFMHFGAELSEEIRQSLALGDRLALFFDQPQGEIVPINVSILLIALLWAGYWKDGEAGKMRSEMNSTVGLYWQNKAYKDKVDTLIASARSFKDLVDSVRDRRDLIYHEQKGNN